MSGSTAPGARDPRGLDFVPTSHSTTYPFIDPTKANFAGRHILITGASKGIGRATAVSYTRAGASGLALAARSDLSATHAALLQAAKDAGRAAPKVVLLKMDVTDAEAVRAGAATVQAELGYIDILINNAGALEKWMPIGTSDVPQWLATWNTNTVGTYLPTRYFWALLTASPHADRTIINTSSIGQNGLAPGAGAYQAAKLAVARLTEFIAVDGAPDGVLAFCIHPGAVPSELALRMPGFMHEILHDEPEIAGDTLVFLTSERRDWLAGRYVSCQWDMQEFMAMREEIVKGDLLKVRMAVGGGANTE